MKNYRVLFSIILTAIILSSCQKGLEDLNVVSPIATTARVKTYTEDLTTSGGHTVTTFNLSYDASGRLISMISASSPGDKFLYQYPGSTVVMDLYNSSLLSIHETFFLNSYSFIDSTFQYNDTKDTMTEKYLYNANRQLITLKQYDYKTSTGAVLWETTNYTYDANGNLTREANSSSITSYEYSTLLNTFSLGIEFLPAPKYFVSKTTYTSGGSTIILTHTYTFDSSNRLIKEKVVADSGEILIKTYTY